MSIVVDARLLHYNQAGIGRYLRSLYAAMARVAGEGATGRPKLIVLYHRRDRQRALREAWPDAAVAWTPPHHRWERWALGLEVARLRPRLLHSPDHVCPQPLGWRTVLTVHDLAFRRLPETHSPASRAYYAGLARSVRQAARVICVSEATRRDLIDLVGAPPDRLRVVHEAPDPAFTPDGPRAAAARPYFFFIGTVEPRKNVAGIVRALARLPASGRPQLWIAGAPGFGAEPVRALVRTLGLNGDVRFLGPQTTEQAAALYRGALALVYPSLLEGFGLPVLEAMAAGVPVIASNRSSIPEVAGDAADLVEPEDTAALAGAMGRLVDDAAHRETLRTRGFARARLFTWERAARETLAVFDEALAEP